MLLEGSGVARFSFVGAGFPQRLICAISKLESGARNLSWTTAQSLCRALDCTMQQLAGERAEHAASETYIASLIGLMTEQQRSAMITLAHAMLPHVTYTGPHHRETEFGLVGTMRGIH